MQTAVLLSYLSEEERSFLLEWGQGKKKGFAIYRLVSQVKKHREILAEIQKGNIPLVVAEEIMGVNGVKEKEEILFLLRWYQQRNKSDEDLWEKLKKKIKEVKAGFHQPSATPLREVKKEAFYQWLQENQKTITVYLSEENEEKIVLEISKSAQQLKKEFLLNF